VTASRVAVDLADVVPAQAKRRNHLRRVPSKRAAWNASKV
jgi:hypothetical protein